MFKKKNVLVWFFVVMFMVINTTDSSDASINWGTSVYISTYGQVVDSITYNGKTVNAIYAPRNQVSNYDSNNQFCCAAFVSKFYNQVYGITVNNLDPGNIPNDATGKGYFYKVSTPQVGDIAGSSEHWAIVKAVSGNSITLIEQNCWDTSYTSAKIGRVLNLPENSYWFWRYSGAVSPDTSAPIISNVRVTNVTSQGYTVTCTVSDNVGVTSVRFPTWSDQNGQDDIVWHEGTLQGNTATITITPSQHGYGTIITHIYAYDAAGNSSCFAASAVIPAQYTPVSVTSYNGHVYAIFDEKLDWNSAKSVCASMGGHLATITSASETSVINKLINAGNSNAYHIGLYEVSEGNWKWVNGEKLSYTHWAANEPDNAQGTANENVVAINSSSKGWCDIQNSYSAGFILEIDTALSPSVTKTYGNSKYQVYNIAMPYEVAKKYCEIKGGKLAVINTSAKNSFITNMIKGLSKSKFYFGYQRTSTSATWKNTNGSSQSYSNWEKGQPDGYCGIQNVAVLKSDGEWDDECYYGSHIGFIMETALLDIQTATLSSRSYIYSGTAKQPSVTVKYGSKVLTKGIDYTVTYSNNLNIGTAKVIITGKGNYKGTITKTFTIKPATVTSFVQKTPYSTTSITMLWNRVSGTTGYEVYRATSKNGTYSKVKTTTSTSFKNGKLTRGKTYYYKVRAYKIVNGTKIYGNFSSVKAMGTKPQTPIIELRSGNSKAKIIWKKISGISGYEVYMSASSSGTYSKIKTSGSNNTAYLKTGLTRGKKYYFKVRSYRTVSGKKIYSGWSSIESVTVK
ncbi:MAG: hypothetical protein E7270_08380 [Lachnospiraceae bacterium]|nr:hypothetical protein [Lachnospiraceae bacterium]